jgi:hypothetical protein
MHDSASPHDDELTALEAQLGALAPLARIDRDRLMFAAGQRVGRRRLRLAHALLVATSAICGALLALLVATPAARHDTPPGSRPPGDARSVAGAGSQFPGAPDAPDDASVVSAATLEAPTNYRLLRRLSDDLDRRIAYATEPAAADEQDRETRPPPFSRALLKRYLETTPGRL